MLKQTGDSCSIQRQEEKFEAVNPEDANYRFNEWNESAAKHLSKEGFVVIKSILKQEEINEAKVLLWNFLSDLGWKRNDPLTWNKGVSISNGIIWGKGAGQCELQWFIRTRPYIVETFANIWSSQDIYKKQDIIFDYKRDIITSMDGFNVFRPWYLNHSDVDLSKWKTKSGWYHIDQNIKRKPNLETIQGIVSLYDEDKSTGSTVFIPGSHKWVQQLLPNLTIHQSDFVMIPSQKLNQKNPKKILLCCKSGDLVLWDSRCIHCSSPAIISLQEMRKIHNDKLNKIKQQHIHDDDEKKNDLNVDVDAVNVAPLLRAVSYICMSPKLKVKSKDIIKQRIKAYETHSTCSHFPQNCRILHKPMGIKEQSIENVNDQFMQSLIGLDILTDKKYKNIENNMNQTNDNNTFCILL